MTLPILHIGLDAGGTKTALLAGADLDHPTLALTGPPANLQRNGLDQTAGVLAKLILRALHNQPTAALGAVCAGVAGAGNPDDRHRLAAALGAQLTPHSPTILNVMHDGAIALEGAFDGGSGMIVIAGTGSILYARTPTGAFHRAGGWGYLLGDDGSGHALGLAGLRAVAHALDGGPDTSIRVLLAERFALTSRDVIIRRVYREDWPVHQAAPLVIDAAERGDRVAERIVTAQVHALAQQALWLQERADALEPRLALLGGLNRSAYYKVMLSDALSAHLPGWHIQDPIRSPVAGALRIALASASGS